MDIIYHKNKEKRRKTEQAILALNFLSHKNEKRTHIHDEYNEIKNNNEEKESRAIYIYIYV